MTSIRTLKTDKIQATVKRVTSGRIPTEHGDFQLLYYTNSIDNKEHLAFCLGDVAGEDILTRVHSECFTGDVMGSRRCDCGEQLQRSMALVAAKGQGVIVYLRQEGRGIGLMAKLDAYNLQDQGYDTVDANLMLGHEADEREYSLAACILEDLGVASVQLMTNNPLKISALQASGIKVSSRVSLEAPVNADNKAYLLAKATRMDHMLDMSQNERNIKATTTANVSARGKNESEPAN
ncbi:GTP cyclohydrolase II [Pseudohongiella acticola]|jgi:GTP cyclohydrolase II|uniref:GTP cyclohydrolase-2 n=1 Tax=Pseudohongiella acticola TaxID=1524254 RepID=A0A1E8CH62_9GAMM|nr:GTP cyclohydrolase II [Pseudohongiella acticola]OFE11577.1 GTP cyclohydrolase II [Pseudohongiella acticola]